MKLLKNKKNEIIIFDKQSVKLEVNMKDETVWLTQEQINLLMFLSNYTNFRLIVVLFIGHKRRKNV